MGEHLHVEIDQGLERGNVGVLEDLWDHGPLATKGTCAQGEDEKRSTKRLQHHSEHGTGNTAALLGLGQCGTELLKEGTSADRFFRATSLRLARHAYLDQCRRIVGSTLTMCSFSGTLNGRVGVRGEECGRVENKIALRSRARSPVLGCVLSVSYMLAIRRVVGYYLLLGTDTAIQAKLYTVRLDAV